MTSIRVMLCLAVGFVASAARAADEMPATSVLIKLIDQVDVPAREAGVLDKVLVKEGDMVTEGALLAGIEDVEAQLDKRKAELELVAARQQAENNVKVRFAKKSLEVAESEWTRASEAEKRFKQSVSKTELDQIRLLMEKSTLEVEQAGNEIELARVTRDLKANEVEIAQNSIRERQVTSPLAGQVVDVKRRRGEWVQPGQPILRILRLDKLRAEGLLPAQVAVPEAVGRPVKITVKLSDQSTADFAGTIVFVNPEIDPVNGQTRVWAEFENTGLRLRPGLHGAMTIEGADSKK